VSLADPVGAGPEARRPAFLWLLFGCCAAPLFWIGQLVLGYAVAAYACYPGDGPLMTPPVSLFALLIAFDAIALAACFAGGAVSLSAWLRTRKEEDGGLRRTMHVGEGRSRFLALWGLMSSLWFFFAILFNTIASVLAPLCGE